MLIQSASLGHHSQKTYGHPVVHARCFTMWMAGGGIKPGIVMGDEGPGSRARLASVKPLLE